MIKANTIEEILREKIIKLALLQYNKQYVHGKHGPETFDCAGLVWYLYHEILNIDIYKKGYGISTTTKIMTSSYGNLKTYQEGINKNINIKPGDIVFFHRQSKEEIEPKPNNKYPGHCGIYINDNNFIHCTRTKEKVIINNLEKNKYWKRILVGTKDIITDISKER